jgi:hypothetical protein
MCTYFFLKDGKKENLTEGWRKNLPEGWKLIVTLPEGWKKTKSS